MKLGRKQTDKFELALLSPFGTPELRIPCPRPSGPLVAAQCASSSKALRALSLGPLQRREIHHLDSDLLKGKLSA